MADLGQTLTSAPPLAWLIGTVKTITGGTFTMTLNGGDVYNVGKVDQYVPIVGDVVHVLSWPPNGMLCIGSNNTPLVTRPSVTPAAGDPLIVEVSSRATYVASTGVWLLSASLQSPDMTACWFYPPDAFLPLAGVALGTVEIQLNLLDGGPPELIEHTNPLPAGPLVPVTGGVRWAQEQPPLGVASWVPLPLEWGLDLISGASQGIGCGGGLYDGSYATAGATGRIRLTPL